MDELKRTMRDGGERLVLRCEFPTDEDAFEWLANVGCDWLSRPGPIPELTELENTCPEGWRLLRMGLHVRPERGKRVYFELQWVSEEWWRRKRKEAGRV